ncbi:septation protein SepH [Corynebacterium sp. H113]|uniref:septation protein SepH n=1 Tax=Corynebacterium sp. H113 TaxID=3133419 RepID=UPI0030B31F18
MRELKLVKDGGESGELILTPVDGDGTEQFRLPLTDDLRATLANTVAENADSANSVTPEVKSAEDSAQAFLDADATDATDASDATAGHDAVAEAEPEADSPVGDVATDTNTAADDDSDNEATVEAAAPKAPVAKPLPPRAPEPRVILRPREIQERIRGGATVEELVEFSGMAAKKIEPFAHPVLAERARIAELGKQSRPRRSDGPAKLTLWEILATAFAARGQELSDAKWDARRDPTGQWIVSVAWNVGHTENLAEWSYQADGSHALTVSRNELAAELVDPDFTRRQNSAVGQDNLSSPQRLPSTWIRPVANDTDPAGDKSADRDGEPTHIPSSNTAQTRFGDAAQSAQGHADSNDDDDLDSFLQHPDEGEHPKRRRKTVMPSWEDVLLGVRPKEPKK